MAKTILEEAMEDAKLLKETAIENAKNVLVEAISPKIKEFVSSQLGEQPVPVAEMGAGPMGMASPMGLGMALPQEAGSMYEKHADEEEDLALLAKMGMLPGAEGEEAEEGEEDMDEANIASAGAPVQEGEEVNEEVKEEVVEITNEDLKTALSEVLGGLKLKTEAQVSKGFADATTPEEGGLLDKKSGEHHWKDEEPPAAQDWTVKEAAYKEKFKILASENGRLKKENVEYKQAVDFLKRNLQEVNLFNSKLLYTNKLLHSATLNNKQRVAVIEMFDKAQTLREVEFVYKSLSESLKITGVLGESKQVPQASKARSSRYTTPSSTLLKEGADRGEAGDPFRSRMEELAGLKNLVD